MNERRLTACDAHLERALHEFRCASRRIRHGRCYLVLEKEGGLVIGHTIEDSPLTTLDIERIMRETPLTKERQKW